MAAIVPHQSANDLWADAADQLPDEEKQHINFNRPDKLQILVELREEAEKSKQTSIDKRWKFVRKSGETVVIRDVFEKIIRWVDTFKQIGDIAVQYDPVHASLPWAGIRFLLQIAVNDTQKLELVVESLAWIAELISRYALTEVLYKSSASYDEGLKGATVKLYASILGYLSKAKHHFDQGTAKRILKSVALVDTPLETGLEAIRKAEREVHPWLELVDKDDSVRNYKDLMHLLQGMDTPLRRMDYRLEKLKDNLETTQRNKILRWLSSEPYRQHHIQASQDVLSGTGQWLLSDSNFKQWKDESASSIIWLHGIAGSGKSKLVSIVIEDALNSFKAGSSPQPVYFYCSRNPAEPARSDPKAIFASFARQLSSTRPAKPLLKPTINLYQEAEAEDFVSGPPQLKQSLDLIMQPIELYPQTTIILDALDECDPATRLDLLRNLEHILQHSCSLVKIFVSSRNDQDIVLRLNGYLNLEINSRRNNRDIARFVNTEVERLTKDGKLLRGSKSKDEMKALIIRRVTEDAADMFRWASMQLQYLCSFKFDIDIKEALGRLPPDLYALYGEIYDVLSKTPGEQGVMVFKNVLRWLLCAERTLHTEELLAVVSINPSDKTDSEPILKQDVLEICNNLVVFDDQLDTFRFAHLSVREFLEQRLNILEANRLMAELCLWSVLSGEDELAVTDHLSQLKLCASSVPTDSAMSRPTSEILHGYAVIYWPTHCRLAEDHRELPGGALKTLLRHMLSHEPSFYRWIDQLQASRSFEYCDRGVQEQLCATLTLDDSRLLAYDQGRRKRRSREVYFRRRPRSSDSFRSSILKVCCAFDLKEQIEFVLGDQMPGRLTPSEHQESLRLAAEYGSSATIRQLLMTKHWTNMEISSMVMTEASGNEKNAKELITLLFSHTGGTAAIGEEELDAATYNTGSGEAVMPLLLRRLRRDVSITLESVEAAAGNPAYGYHVMRFLLHQLETDVKVTTRMLEAAKSDARYSDEVLQLLFDIAGSDTPVTLEIVKEAAGNERTKKEVMLRLLNQLGPDTPTTLDLLRIATGNKCIRKEVMHFLLDQLGANILITLDLVKTAAGNKGIRKEVMYRLLDQLGANGPITLDLVKTAAGNKGIGKEVMHRLLDQLGANVPITLDLVKTAAGNRGIGKEVMHRLLDQLGANVPITLDVIEAAAGIEHSEKEVMLLLLGRLEASASITAELTATILQHQDADVIAFLLDQRGADVPITKEVVRAALRGSRVKARRKLAVLLERREQEMWNAIMRLQGTVQSIWDTGALQELNAQWARVRCDEGWIYLRRERSS